MKKLTATAIIAATLAFASQVANADYGYDPYTGNIGASSQSAQPPRTHQEIFTTGRWGDDVPVFRDRNSFFNARDRNRVNNVVCRLKKGMHVKFIPYLSWGVGKVTRNGCTGWIDRGVVR